MNRERLKPRPIPLIDLPMFGDDWRCRWMWANRSGRYLHRVASIKWADSDKIWGQGVTACAQFVDFHMPGLFSRMGVACCPTCCLVANVPEGDGAPFNRGIDA